MSDYNWTVRVSSAGPEVSHALVRQHRFTVGRPLQFDAGYSWVTPLEYALGALGAEIVNGLQRAATRRRIALDALEALVRGELANPLVHFGVVGAEGHPGLARIHVKLYAAARCEAGVIEMLWSETRPRLPLTSTFDASGLLEVTLSVLDA